MDHKRDDFFYESVVNSLIFCDSTFLNRLHLEEKKNRYKGVKIGK